MRSAQCTPNTAKFEKSVGRTLCGSKCGNGAVGGGGGQLADGLGAAVSGGPDAVHGGAAVLARDDVAMLVERDDVSESRVVGILPDGDEEPVKLDPLAA